MRGSVEVFSLNFLAATGDILFLITSIILSYILFVKIVIILRGVIFDVGEPLVVFVEADPWTNEIGANKPRHTTHYVHDGGPTIIREAEVAQPTVSPAPGEPNRKNKPRSNKREENVCFSVSSLGNGPGCDRGHHHAERNIKDAFAVILIRVMYADELLLAQDTSFSLDAETKSDDEKCQAGDGHNQDCLQEDKGIPDHLDGACFLHKKSNLSQNHHDCANQGPYCVENLV